MSRAAALVLAAALAGCASALARDEPPLPPSRVQAALIERLRSHVQALAGDIGPRCRPDALRRAAEYVRAQFAAAELTPDEDAAANVSVEARAGRDGTRLVVGAHYDSVCETPGADDNASGVAVLLELARLSAQARDYTRFVAFANEEARLERRGSFTAARASRAAVEPLEGMISLEMLGYYREEPGTQSAPPGVDAVADRRGNFLAAVANSDSREFLDALLPPLQAAASLRIRPVVASSVLVSAIARSDHASYWDAGYPAIMLTDTANFRNPNYHEPGDTPDTLDYARMAEITVGLASALASFAPDPP